MAQWTDINPHEAKARADKAYRLAREFENRARAIGAGDWPAILDLARRATHVGAWLSVAQLAGLRDPSEATCATALGILEARAKGDGTDPFEVLPS
jgi:hypothetical protein